MALRVLLADESTTIRKVMQLALQDFAVEVKSVHSGIDVIEVAKTFQPDIIFADVLLQKRNGYEVTGDVKRDPLLSSIPVVLMWSSFMDLDEKLAQISSADRRLEKPFDVENLRQLVLELVPKTRSQRLAHFLKFPDSFTEPLQAEEREKLESTAARPVTQPPQSQSAPQTPATPVPENNARRIPPMPPKSPSMAGAGPMTGSATIPVPPPLPPRKPKATPIPDPEVQDFDRTVRVDLAALKQPEPLGAKATINAALEDDTRAHAPEPEIFDDANDTSTEEEIEATPPAKAGAPPSGWNINSFEDIDVFAEISDAETYEESEQEPTPEIEDDASDSADEENFAQVNLARKPTNDQNAPLRDLDKTVVTRPAIPDDLEPKQTSKPKAPTRAPSSDDREPWSHQDLSRFKIDLPALELGEYDGDDSPLEIDLTEEGDERDLEAKFARPERSSDKASAVQHEEHDLTFDHESIDEASFQLNDAVENIAPLEFSDTALETADEDLIEVAKPAARSTSRTVSPRPETAMGTLSPERIEEIVRAQTKDVIEKIVRRLIPDMATEIIREEIQRLLDEQSTGADLIAPAAPTRSPTTPTPAPNQKRPR